MEEGLPKAHLPLMDLTSEKTKTEQLLVHELQIVDANNKKEIRKERRNKTRKKKKLERKKENQNNRQ